MATVKLIPIFCVFWCGLLSASSAALAESPTPTPVTTQFYCLALVQNVYFDIARTATLFITEAPNQKPLAALAQVYKGVRTTLFSGELDSHPAEQLVKKGFSYFSDKEQGLYFKDSANRNGEYAVQWYAVNSVQTSSDPVLYTCVRYDP